MTSHGNERHFKMAAELQMFLFLFKSKYRRKSSNIVKNVWCLVVISMCVVSIVCYNECTDNSCGGNGKCMNGTCICYDGWQGPSCQFCGGKVRLSEPYGIIHDGLGNYSIDVKCSWLIDAGTNASVRLHLEEFATECGWDHLYIFDGDSVSSPLLAVFSGLMYKDGYSVRRIPEIVAQSGSALLHFYSDVAYNMTGFNISYRINSCPSRYSNKNCSGHGVCIDGICTCDAMFQGEACDQPLCPNNCSHPNGRCNMERHRCECVPHYKGDDCSQEASLGYWEVIDAKGGFSPVGSASHAAVVFKDSMYILGGESYKRGKMTYIYDFTGNIWETLHMDIKPFPTGRYGHSAVLFGDKIYMYGGVEDTGTVSNELWAFDVSSKIWENVTVRADHCNGTGLHSNGSHICSPLRSAGHTATLVLTGFKKSDRMIVIFGHSPVYGYLNTVQEFYFGTREWHIVKTQGHPVKGGYGHSAVLDPYSEKIYVYGGLMSDRQYNPFLSDKLYSYDTNTHFWTLLRPGPSARYLHTASFLSGGLMLVFGGNTHNDTVHSHGAKCYSGEMLSYDVVCDSWQILNVPKDLRSDVARFGHSAVRFENSLYIYGGFDGIMLNDILKYTPGKCDGFATQPACLNNKPGIKCLWDRLNQKCIPLTSVPKLPFDDKIDREENAIYVRCSDRPRADTHRAIKECSQLSDCVSCLTTSFECQYCAGSKTESCVLGSTCKESHNSNAIPSSSDLKNQPLITHGVCTSTDDPICHQLHSCQACTSHPYCHWDITHNRCGAMANLTIGESQDQVQCTSSCSEYTSCYNCTVEECIWCQNEGRCVDKNAYTGSFPYGQCREWTTIQGRCRSTKTGKPGCSFYKTCNECQSDPECGWCDDGSGTGLGKCLPGGNHGNYDVSEIEGNDILNHFGIASHTGGGYGLKCAEEKWFFTKCPPCQCNGHSTCSHNSSVCNQPCGNLTTGDHCDRCISGYHGNPINGGQCSPCDCSNHGTLCNPETGRCFCTTKGIIGDKCDKCDTTNHYHGDPANGSCFYDLTIDYQFTFNLSKKDDRHFTQINFKNSPPKSDIDADFSITCSESAKMNISIKTVGAPEKQILWDYNCTTFKSRFAKSEHVFGVIDNVTQTTFYVYVYDFQPPLWIVISFSQYPKLNLQQFFITFSTCFLLLLLIAALLWKIKQKYDMFRRRQRLFVELEQMASRPFSQVLVEIGTKDKVIENNQNNENFNEIVQNCTTVKKRKKDCPSPIALEPCCGNRAAVLSLLVRLPTCDDPYTPSGQSGLAIASALVTLGNPRKVSLDPTTKTETKSKGRKSLSSQHPDSCI